MIRKEVIKAFEACMEEDRELLRLLAHEAIAKRMIMQRDLH